MSKPQVKRTYVVGGNRLVKASGKQSARNHVAKDTIPVELASQDTLVELVSRGIKVESADERVEQQELTSQDGPLTAEQIEEAGTPPPNAVCAKEPFLDIQGKVHLNTESI